MSEFKVLGIVVTENGFDRVAYVIKMLHFVSLHGCMCHCQHLKIIMGMTAGDSYLCNVPDAKAGCKNRQLKLECSHTDVFRNLKSRHKFPEYCPFIAGEVFISERLLEQLE